MQRFIASELGTDIRPQQWQNGRRGQDGWGRWTRRRKWYRDAELVEVEDDSASGAAPASSQATLNVTELDEEAPLSSQQPIDAGASATTSSSGSKPELPPRPATLAQRTFSPTPPSLSNATVANPDGEDEYNNNNDSASMLSTSSKSARFGGSVKSGKSGAGTPALRRRGTDTSSRRGGQGARRDSGAVMEEEEEAAALGTSLGLSPGAEGHKGWGVGDEVRMGLE